MSKKRHATGFCMVCLWHNPSLSVKSLVMVMDLYSAFSIYAYSNALFKLLIGPRHTQAPRTAAISPLAISPTHIHE